MLISEQQNECSQLNFIKMIIEYIPRHIPYRLRSSAKYFLSVFLLTATIIVQAQKTDSANTRLNTIKLNMLSSYLYSNSAAISYERVAKPYQTWGVMIGYVKFPTIRNFGSNVIVQEDSKQTGYVFGGEYRFYFRKENKFKAPHGVYLGPYTTFYSFSNTRNLSITAADGVTLSQAVLNTDITVLNIGVQLGYQFVLNDRWTFDLVFLGPSVSNYSLKSKLDGDLTQEAILENEIIAALANRFPILKDLISDQGVNLHGKTSSWASGFRYQINIGYRFGGGRKK